MRSILRLESFLLKFAIICIIALVVAQGLLADDSTRWILTFFDPLEGMPEPAAVPVMAPVPPLRVTVMARGSRDLSRSYLIVNNVRVASFTDNLASVTVRPGDEISVDPGGPGAPLLFRVVETTPGIVNPAIGRQVVAAARPISLGRVEWRGAR